MNIIRSSAHGRRESTTIRFGEARVVDEDIEFEGVSDAGEKIRFAIAGDILRAFDGEQPAADLARAFATRRQMIFGVASRVFNAGVRGDPIRLQRGLFRGV